MVSYFHHFKSCFYVIRYCIPSAKDEFFSHAQRSSIVDYILRRKSYTDDANKKYSYGECFSIVILHEILQKLFIAHMIIGNACCNFLDTV